MAQQHLECTSCHSLVEQLQHAKPALHAVINPLQMTGWQSCESSLLPTRSHHTVLNSMCTSTTVSKVWQMTDATRSSTAGHTASLNEVPLTSVGCRPHILPLRCRVKTCCTLHCLPGSLSACTAQSSATAQNQHNRHSHILMYCSTTVTYISLHAGMLLALAVSLANKCGTHMPRPHCICNVIHARHACHIQPCVGAALCQQRKPGSTCGQQDPQTTKVA